MAQEAPPASAGQESGGGDKLELTETTLASIIPSILEDCLYNIIHDVVLSVHREEKLLRMASAAVLAEAEAAKVAGVPSTPTQATPSKPGAPALQPAPQVTLEIPCARYENGRVYLKENPLKKLDKNYCPHCKLPRLKFPLTGAHAKPPDSLNAQYCTRHPYIQKPGHDVYGNPFPIDQSGKTKKERELLKRQERMEKDNTPGSQDTTTEDGVNGAAGAGGEAQWKRLMAGGKPASYVPWHTCPNCKRSLLITKFAQHLEKCLGIGGRAARNVAAVRLSAGVNGSAAGSVQGSRVGTPQPGTGNGNGKRDKDAAGGGGGGGDDDGDGEDESKGPARKKAKTDKKGRKDKDAGPIKEKIILKIGNNKVKINSEAAANAAGKRLPKSGTNGALTNIGSEAKESSAKRARDEGDGGDTPTKKRLKVARENSTQSLSEAAGAAAAAGGGGVESS